jgi:hypothetical protein
METLRVVRHVLMTCPVIVAVVGEARAVMVSVETHLDVPKDVVVAEACPVETVEVDGTA